MGSVVTFRDPAAVLEGEPRERVMKLCRDAFPSIACAAIEAGVEEMWKTVRATPEGGKLSIEDWRDLAAEAFGNELERRNMLEANAN